MKFLCDNCKAKYQIADEKIAGRTLRMKCRKCGHDIVLRGTGDTGPTAAVTTTSTGRDSSKPSAGSAPNRRPGRAAHGTTSRGGSGASRRPLGSDFRKQVTGGASDSVRATPSPLDQWHVAINDVPVGPIRRNELARKIGAGAVDAGSLVWREGFDDWRPLKEVPELLPLLRGQHQHSPPPPPPTTGARRTPGVGRTSARGGRGARSTGTRSEERPAAHSNVIPIGGRLGAGAAPAVEPPEEDDADFPDVATLVSEGPPADPLGADAAAAAGGLGGDEYLPTAPDGPPSFAQPDPADSERLLAPPRRRSPGLPAGAWIGIAGAAAFGITFAVLLAPRMLGEQPQAATTQPTEPESTAPEPEEPAEAEMVISPEEATEEQAEPEEEGEPEKSPRAAAGPARRARTRGTTDRSTGTQGKQLSDEQRKRLARFADDTGSSPSNIRVPGGSSGGSTRSGTGLDARQLRSVVNKNQMDLQRCYNNAIRGMSEPPAVRMDVHVTIGTSGTVTRVRAEGNDVSGMRQCLQQTVRRWRFPSSGKTTQTQFPVVFQPGS